jgi:hypothetical protein
MNIVNYCNLKIMNYCNKNNILFISLTKKLDNIKYYKEDLNHLNYDGYCIINKIISKIIK